MNTLISWLTSLIRSSEAVRKTKTHKKKSFPLHPTLLILTASRGQKSPKTYEVQGNITQQSQRIKNTHDQLLCVNNILIL
jgi:hypothetical protein